MMDYRLFLMDRYGDYIPVASTVTNLAAFYCQRFIIPKLTPQQIERNRYYRYLQNKSALRSAILLVPVLGNISVYYYDTLPKSTVEEGINAWLDEPFLHGFKEDAARRIREALPPDTRKLDLRLRLNKIPREIGLMTHLTELDLGDNRLKYLPKEIFRLTNLTKLGLSNTPLLSLSKDIGNLTGLTKLDLRGTNFKSIPTEIGRLTNLTTLWLDNSGLTYLPTEIGRLTRVTALRLYWNKLTSLPQEIGNLTQLTELMLLGNPLTSLPREIGSLIRLNDLEVSHCNLTSLPQEVGNLINLNQLNLYKNRSLRELPMSLGQIPGLTHIYISETHIESDIRDAILSQCRMMRDDNAVRILPGRFNKWKAIANCTLDIQELSDERKKTLNEWLLRLERTKDFEMVQFSLARTVCSILEDVFKNQEFAELFFSQAEANNACCEDRAAMALNEIYTSWNLMCRSLNLPKKEKLQMMTGVAKTLCLRKKLQKLIHKEERESVEIFLYYESTLKMSLNLVTAIESMRYSAIGRRNWINEESLARGVNADFFAELFELPLFEKMVLEERKSEWEAINAKFSRELEQLGDCPPGGPDDEMVLNYGCRQGEIMGEWKREKMAVARQWYEAQ